MQNNQISIKMVFLFLLIEGFITISLEILSMRQLLPFVGNSVMVTSLIIGVFLLFLSFGYYIGGNCKEKHLEKLKFNFIVAALFVGVGLSYVFCQLFFSMLDTFFSGQRLASLFLYLLLILAPVVLLLGQTIPITTNFFNQSDSVSKVSSRALFLSTIGSFLGAILTSLVLLNYLGVAKSILINVVLLFILSTLIAFKIKHQRIVQVLIITLGGGYLYFVNVDFEKKYFNLTNNYANYKVFKSRNHKEKTSYFVVNNALMSSLTSENKGANYVEYVKKVVFNELNLRNKRMLVIGAGGFTFSHENTFNNKITYVDIDKDIKSIAETYFLKAPIKGRFIGVDARIFINQSTEHYDLIFSDSYNSTNIPSFLLSKEYFEQLKQHLTLNGYIVFNMLINPFYQDRYSRKIDNTLNAVFSHCLKHPMGYSVLTNVIYVCQKMPENSETGIYTDEQNTASIDKFMVNDTAKVM